ncbi:MAG: TonB-dependent receptor plug domain-containing protein [Pseudomonadales bacterium]|nr:TonB-dependent receptor plug domain-containing protein [Pseudomonadales bacterium]
MFLLCALCLLSLALSPQAAAQLSQEENPTDDSTVVYPASYFAEFFPISANDMLNRIPGISLALRGNRGGRGLGSGAGEVLINGQRITGKNNEGRSQLSRIAADQVDYIEIIRGTSEELDVRGSGQVVNVVLLDTPSRSSTTVQLRSDYLQDGTLDPGGQFSYSGQTGDLNYLLSVDADPRYRAWESLESSFGPDGELLEVRRESRRRDETGFQTSANLGYNFERSVVQFNAMYETRGEVPDRTNRSIYDVINHDERLQFDDNTRSQDAWELGGDFEYDFASAGTYRALFIVNDRDSLNTRTRFDRDGEELIPNLFTENGGRDRERIMRTSYTFDVAQGQGLEMGFEGAQTIRDNSLRLGLDDEEGEPSPDYANLIPVQVDNANTTVEELRYEPFAIHNWQINPRMSLESSLVMEISTIEQSGDVSNTRDFEFFRPSIDYRFNITPSLQLRAGVRKDVEQLSFSDFSTIVDGGDEDQNTQDGNPNIRQEQSWRYELNLEMRLPNDLGVVNSQFWYRDVEDHIDRIDVSTGPDDLESARGNIGDGKRYGLNLDMSTKLDTLGIRNALLTTGVRLRDSEYIDPFLGIKRRQNGNGRWQTNVGFRHDVTQYGLTYGFDYSNASNGSTGRLSIDVDDIEEFIEAPRLNAYVEKIAFGNVTFRLESNNITDAEWCRKRTRFAGATALGIVEEIEDYCNGGGMELALRVRTTF